MTDKKQRCDECSAFIDLNDIIKLELHEHVLSLCRVCAETKYIVSESGIVNIR